MLLFQIYFIRRYKLFKEFINIYVVEMIYNNQEYMVTSYNPKHLQLKTETSLWHKENMINLAIEKLLSKNYKAFAWFDANIEFDKSSCRKIIIKKL